MIEVINLSTQEKVYYMGFLGERQAVICAYAQSISDWNTWDYDKYESQVLEGKNTYLLGDWCVLKN